MKNIFKQKEYSRTSLYCMISILLMCLPACSDKEEYFPESEEESVDVIFSIKAPSAATTYAISTTEENAITDIDVLVFKETAGTEYFAYKSKGEQITGSGNQLEFMVTLRKDDTNRYRFVILANATEYLDALGSISTVAVKEIFLKRLESYMDTVWTANNNNDFKPIPMWGETDITYTVNESTNVDVIRMVRSLLRIDVVSPTVPLDKFELKEVYVYNWKKNGRIVPELTDEYWNSNPASWHALLPSLPESPQNVREPLLYNTVADQRKMEYEIYIHEAEAIVSGKELDATALVIGGIYNESAEMSYYRVDFKDKVSSSTGEDSTVYKHLLRNHKYVLTITGVKDEGYADPDTAFYFQKANITVDITTWNLAEQQEVDIPPTFNFSVSQSVFEFNSYITSGILKVTCDHPNGWRIDESATIGNINLTVSGSNVLVEATGNGSFVIEAGNLRKTITVRYT